ncbi:hypothetical protein [Kamptonema formosum]|nr:hypothetical protein [Oscillatoria sp. PCC 10802]
MSDKPISRYVTRNPDILQGEPMIAGTRTLGKRHCRFQLIGGSRISGQSI